jgi:sialate O-acetylesterase
MKTKIQLLLILFFSISTIQAKLKVASVLGDNMVLQRNTEVKIWGTANPLEKIQVITSWNNLKTRCSANENGKWFVNFSPGVVSEPTVCDRK